MNILTKFLFSFLLIFFFLSIPCLANSGPLANRIEQLDKINHSAVIDSINKICWDIYQLEKTDAVKCVTVLLKKTKSINMEAYLNALAFSLTYQDSGKIESLNYIYNLADENNLVRLMAWTYEAKSEYYKSHEKYDSSMSCILRARDLYESGGYTEDLVTVMHTIGDLYFAAAAYDEAERMYKKIQKLIGNKVQWENWRKNTIRNDLGLIEIKRKNYSKAIALFTESLSDVSKRNTGKIDSISLSYIYSQLAETYLLLNDLKQSLKNCLLGIKPAIKYNQYEFAANIYLVESKINFKEGKLDSALYFAKLSKSLLGTGFNSLSFSVTLNEYLAELYDKRNNVDESLKYYKKVLLLKDSLVQNQSKWKYLQTLAENEYDKLNLQFENKKKENRLIIFSVSALLILSFGIYTLRKRLKKSNVKLVRKNLEIENRTYYNQGVINSNPGNKTSDVNEEEKSDSLLRELDKKMRDEKLYLQKDMSIQKAAEIIGTNRTYLSRAINNNAGINFSTYINNFRIKEAIELVKSGTQDKFKIEGIAEQCGFNSRSSFIKAFESYTGVTPSFFIKNYKTKTSN